MSPPKIDFKDQARVTALHPILNPVYEVFGNVHKPTVKVHHLPKAQLDTFDELFPDRAWRVQSGLLTSGLAYLESLTELAVEDAFQKMQRHHQHPELIYVVGESDQLLDHHAEQVWELELPTDDFAQYGSVRSCTHLLEDHCDCAGTEPSAYLFIHTLYYHSPTEVAQALFRTTDRYAVSVHHPFHAVSGQLGFCEVQFNVAHGRVSTTRFPSYDRSDLSWLYTRDQYNFYVDSSYTLTSFDMSKGLPPDLTSADDIYTLYWELLHDSHDIQLVQFGLRRGFLPSLPKQLESASWYSLALGSLAYGLLEFQDVEGVDIHAEQVWGQVCVHAKSAEKRVYTLPVVHQAIKQVPASHGNLALRCQQALLSLRKEDTQSIRVVEDFY